MSFAVFIILSGIILLVLGLPLILVIWFIIFFEKEIINPPPPSPSIPEPAPYKKNRHHSSYRNIWYDDFDDDDFWEDDWDDDDYWEENWNKEYDEYRPRPVKQVPVKKEKDFLEKHREQGFKEAWMFRESPYEVGDYCRICQKLIESGECEHYTPWWKLNTSGWK